MYGGVFFISLLNLLTFTYGLYCNHPNCSYTPQTIYKNETFSIVFDVGNNDTIVDHYQGNHTLHSEHYCYHFIANGSECGGYIRHDVIYEYGGKSVVDHHTYVRAIIHTEMNSTMYNTTFLPTIEEAVDENGFYSLIIGYQIFNNNKAVNNCTRCMTIKSDGSLVINTSGTPVTVIYPSDDVTEHTFYSSSEYSDTSTLRGSNTDYTSYQSTEPLAGNAEEYSSTYTSSEYSSSEYSNDPNNMKGNAIVKQINNTNVTVTTIPPTVPPTVPPTQLKTYKPTSLTTKPPTTYISTDNSSDVTNSLIIAAAVVVATMIGIALIINDSI